MTVIHQSGDVRYIETFWSIIGIWGWRLMKQRKKWWGWSTVGWCYSSILIRKSKNEVIIWLDRDEESNLSSWIKKQKLHENKTI